MVEVAATMARVEGPWARMSEAKRQVKTLFHALLARAFAEDLTGFTQEPVRSGRVNVNS